MDDVAESGALLGGAIGVEREFAGRDAGFRTHFLLSLGSALFEVISVGAFDDFVSTRATTNVSIDVTRIASYVAPGVGFIGGEAILEHCGTVRGITTATSLWAAAAVGLASGVGLNESADGPSVLGEIQSVGLPPIRTIRMMPDDDGTTELTTQFWSHPDDATTGRLTPLLSGDVRERVLHFDFTT